MRALIAMLALAAALAACSTARPPAPAPKPACTGAVPAPAGTEDPDGGLGGTGKAPDPCAPAD